MATHNLLLLPGDGIGPEVMAEVRRVIDLFNEKGPERFNTEEALVAAVTTRTGSRSPMLPWRKRNPPTR